MIVAFFLLNLLDRDRESRVTEGKVIPTTPILFLLELLLILLGMTLKSAFAFYWAAIGNWVLIIELCVLYLLEIYASEPYPVVAGIQKGLQVALFVYAAKHFYRMHRIIKLVRIREEQQVLLPEPAALEQP